MIEERNVFLNVDIDNKLDMLKFISEKAEEIGITSNKDELLKDLIKREEEYSTGIQDGFAIPHAKSLSIKNPAVFYIKTTNDIEWETFDGSNVRYIFSLMVPEENENNIHLMMLSKLATCLMDDDFRKEVMISDDKNKLVSYVSNKIKEEQI